MTQFKFRLQSVIQLRERERDTAAEDYQKAMQAIEELNRQIESLQDESQALTPLLEVAGRGRVDTNTVLASRQYQSHIAQQIAGIQETLQKIEEECEKRRQVLVAKEQALKSIEKVKDKQRQEFEALALSRSQLALDEWASTKHWQAQQLKPPGAKET
ncbi:MAG: flagellar export protein FliJ [Aureliella sp.]